MVIAPILVPLHTTARISVQWYGDTAAQKTIVYFHGFPGSRLEALALDDEAKKRNIRILSFDRPGYGASDGDKKRVFTSVAISVKEILNYFDVATVSILAVSGGAPYALAFSALYSDAVDQTVIVSGIGPVVTMQATNCSPKWPDGMALVNRVLLTLGMVLPKFSKLLVTLIAYSWRYVPSLMLVWFRTILLANDVAILNQKKSKRIMVLNVREAFKRGVDGAVDDFSLLVKAWGFEFNAIRNPVHFIHGDADRYVPVSHSKYTQAQIKHSSLQIINGGGHFVAFQLCEEIINRFADK